MLGINRKNGRLVLAAAAATALVQLQSHKAMASPIYSTGFETAQGWTVGTVPYAGENGWLPGYTAAAEGSSSAVIVAGAGVTGGANDNALQLNRVGNTTAIAYSPTYNLSPSGTIVGTVSINYTAAAGYPNSPAGSGNVSPFFGFDLYGGSGSTDIGSFGVDAATGTVLFDNGSNTFNDVGSGAAVAPGAYHSYTLVADYSGTHVELTGYLDFGTVNQVNEGTFASTALSSAGFSNLFLTAQSDGSPDDGNASAYFDNYSVVPEPASMTLIGLASVGFFARRRRAIIG